MQEGVCIPLCICVLFIDSFALLPQHPHLTLSVQPALNDLSVLQNAVCPSALVVVLDVKCVSQAPVFKLVVPSQ